ncbi:phospholipase D/Transphosphatidylase, Phospholipase D-like domain protein [Artemisia annua]|uniref:Phospholipase D/Transphosphatidylase, Phospholipase D-like domain protein n=1 Tax=Artemisia annua TaxID=35608 RepID=A0A2U1LGU3_ARTAN|nr:phospholipase D/Transphosphatidylase, Phospholipase D-like domain protein [Artemisia annua]
MMQLLSLRQHVAANYITDLRVMTRRGLIDITVDWPQERSHTLMNGFGTYNPGIVAQLQQIFDADWNSPYAVPVEPLQDGHAYSS